MANSNSFVRIKRTSKLPFYVTLGYHGSRSLFLSLTHTLLSLARTFLSYAFADQSAPCGATMVSPPGVTGARGPGTTGGHFRTRPHWNTVLKRLFIVQLVDLRHLDNLAASRWKRPHRKGQDLTNSLTWLEAEFYLTAESRIPTFFSFQCIYSVHRWNSDRNDFFLHLLNLPQHIYRIPPFIAIHCFRFLRRENNTLEE